MNLSDHRILNSQAPDGSEPDGSEPPGGHKVIKLDVAMGATMAESSNSKLDTLTIWELSSLT